MSGTGHDDRRVRYLVGRASEEERIEVERRLFEDDAYEEELMAAADEVLYDYLAGRLAAPERLFFEQRFLSVPRHRERLEFLKTLRAALPPPAGARPRTSWLGAAVAAVIAAVAVGALWLFTPPAMAPSRTADVAVHEPAPVVPSPTAVASTPPATATARPRRGTTTAHPVVEVRLPRTAAAAQVALTAETERVRVSVDVAPEPPSFDAVLRSQDGLEIWRAEGLAPPAGEPLVIEVPARLLRTAQYALRIEAETLRGGARPPAVEYRLEVLWPAKR